MAKKAPKPTHYRPKHPRYPMNLKARAAPNAIAVRAFLDLEWIRSHQIAAQIVAAVSQGATANGGKTISTAAMDKWRNLLQPHVYAVLISGGNWVGGAANVLTAARGMGDIAATLTSNSTEIKENQLKAAFRAAKFNTVCMTGGVGGGSWCSFDWL